MGLVLGHGYWISKSRCLQEAKYPLTYHKIRKGTYSWWNQVSIRFTICYWSCFIESFITKKCRTTKIKKESAQFNFEKSLNLSIYIPQNPLGNLFLMKSLNKIYNLLLELLHIILYYQEMPSHLHKERIGTIQLWKIAKPIRSHTTKSGRELIPDEKSQ